MQQRITNNLNPLYKMAMAAGIMMLIIIVLQIAVFVLSPPPETVEGFFALYRQNSFLGLLSMDFLYLFNNLLLVFLYIGIAAILIKEHPSLILSALTLGLVGIACYYPSNPAFEMLTLSNQYYLAEQISKPLYLAAGETLMAGYTGTSFNAYYVMSTLSLLFFSAAAFKSNAFPRVVGFFGLMAGFFMVIPSSAGSVGMIFSLLSLIPWSIFVILLVISFHRHAVSATNSL